MHTQAILDGTFFCVEIHEIHIYFINGQSKRLETVVNQLVQLQ